MSGDIVTRVNPSPQGLAAKHDFKPLLKREFSAYHITLMFRIFKRLHNRLVSA